MYWGRISGFTVVFAVAAILIATSSAQEVAFLDLTKVVHRGLRRPESKLSSNEHYSGAQVTSCLDSAQNIGALRTSFLSLDRTNYQFVDEPIFEVTVENVGSTELRIPFSPHLGDLQPEDAAQKFAYSELRITLWIAAGDHWTTNTGGELSLYGNEDHANTMLTLNPGEWVRVIGKGHEKGHLFFGDDLAKLNMSGHPPVYAQASLFHAVLNEVCISQTHGQRIPIQPAVP